MHIFKGFMVNNIWLVFQYNKIFTSSIVAAVKQFGLHVEG